MKKINDLKAQICTIFLLSLLIDIVNMSSLQFLNFPTSLGCVEHKYESQFCLNKINASASEIATQCENHALWQ